MPLLCMQQHTWWTKSSKVVDQSPNGKVSDRWRHILDRVVRDASVRQKFRDQLANYMSFRGAFGCVDAQEDICKIGVVLWWEDFGSKGHEF